MCVVDHQYVERVTIFCVANDPGCSLIPGLRSRLSKRGPCRVHGSLRGRGMPSA
jgi:hypothetical protein